jgi:hypothetical protein
VFHCRQRRAGPKHPAPEETDRRLAPADFPNIKEGGTFGRFFRRALVTGSGDDLQRSEFYHLADWRLDGRNPGRHLVHALQDNDLEGICHRRPGKTNEEQAPK